MRDGSGDLHANFFRGTATQAQYADLAEVYSTEEELSVGTVVAVGGKAEVRPAKVSDFAIGVISAEPAYLMNSTAEGQAVGLKGRVIVRVKGPDQRSTVPRMARWRCSNYCKQWTCWYCIRISTPMMRN